MSKKHPNPGLWFEGHFDVPAQAGVDAWLMAVSPTHAAMMSWVTAKPALRELEGRLVLEFDRTDVDGTWEPRLFERKHDWWLAGAGTPGARHVEVADHPVLTALVEEALEVLSSNDRDVLEIGARSLRKFAAEIREHHARRSRPELELDHDRARAHVHHLAARMLEPDEAAALAPRHAAFGYGGVLETGYGPVTVHIETGPVVRIDAVPGVLLATSGVNGPVEFSLSARWSLGGWDTVRPKSDHAQRAAEDILDLVKRTYPSQIRAAFAAWACTTLAKADMIAAATARSDALAASVIERLEDRASVAEERIAHVRQSEGPRP